MNDALIRPMREEDVAAIIAVEERAYYSPWTETIFRDCLRVGYSCWVLEREAVILGYGVLSAAVGEAHLLNLCVAPEHQGQGHGRRLLTHFIDVARGHRAEAMFLEVRPSNRAAIALYESTGFNQVGSRRDYYPAPKGREDALIFALAL
ncbi:MAG: ribosomal protein S18-alanine N-acetyltransferase [Thiohalomonadaceae bacterium]